MLNWVTSVHSMIWWSSPTVHQLPCHNCGNVQCLRCGKATQLWNWTRDLLLRLSNQGWEWHVLHSVNHELFSYSIFQRQKLPFSHLGLFLGKSQWGWKLSTASLNWRARSEPLREARFDSGAAGRESLPLHYREEKLIIKTTIRLEAASFFLLS